MNDKTIGEQRVRTDFNPSQNGTVDIIKQETARLINIVDAVFGAEGAPNTEANELREIAMRKYEDAAMWAVKAATAAPTPVPTEVQPGEEVPDRNTTA